MASIQQRMADRAIWWANEGNLGYDWDYPDRTHFYVGGETDCSYFMISIAKEQGLNTGSASYTGDMRSNFTKHGWKWIPWSQIGSSSNLQVGDILLNESYHTAMYVGNNKIAQASANERGGASGGRTGDQGRPNGVGETNVTTFYIYSHGWNGVLRYVGNDPQNGAPSTTPTPTSTPSTPSTTTSNGKLEVDGYWGTDTITALQKALRCTYVDGIISSQPTTNYGTLKGSCKIGWEWVAPRYAEGSACIVALQKKVGSDPDGFCGPNTIRALQTYLGTEVDGFLSDPSEVVKVMQRKLNEGTF